MIALVPAHNEERGIGATVKSLLSQTYHRVDVFVVSDNSTDGTAAIVRDMASRDSRIRLLETVGNKFKKAGALNAAYQALGSELKKYDYALVMDADTILATDSVERGLEEFDLDPELGAVCSRAGVMKQKTDSLFAGLLYYLQRVEYAEFDRSRISQHRSIKVAHGMCTLFSTAALLDVMKRRVGQGRIDCLPYDVRNITEDYELTVILKECGYHVAAGFGMKAWTEVPLKLKDLWTQRVRWLRGGLDTIWQHGWNPSTRIDILNAGFFWMMMMFQVLLLAYALLDVYLGIFHVSNMVLLVMAMMYVDSVYTLRFVQDINRWDYFVRLAFVPQLVYAWFTIAQQLYAYYLFLLRKKQRW